LIKEAKNMKLVYRGVSYEYTPPQVSYPDSSTAKAIKEEFRALSVAEEHRSENRQRSMLMRSLHSVGIDEIPANYSDHVAFS